MGRTERDSAAEPALWHQAPIPRSSSSTTSIASLSSPHSFALIALPAYQLHAIMVGRPQSQDVKNVKASRAKAEKRREAALAYREELDKPKGDPTKRTLREVRSDMLS
jgi:hypothetical protein